MSAELFGQFSRIISNREVFVAWKLCGLSYSTYSTNDGYIVSGHEKRDIFWQREKAADNGFSLFKQGAVISQLATLKRHFEHSLEFFDMTILILQIPHSDHFKMYSNEQKSTGVLLWHGACFHWNISRLWAFMQYMRLSKSQTQKSDIIIYDTHISRKKLLLLFLCDASLQNTWLSTLSWNSVSYELRVIHA